ncbi:unnamed protein product, partial [Iphiclides podalirius]
MAATGRRVRTTDEAVGNVGTVELRISCTAGRLQIAITSPHVKIQPSRASQRLVGTATLQPSRVFGRHHNLANAKTRVPINKTAGLLQRAGELTRPRRENGWNSRAKLLKKETALATARTTRLAGGAGAGSGGAAIGPRRATARARLETPADRFFFC